MAESIDDGTSTLPKENQSLDQNDPDRANVLLPSNPSMTDPPVDAQAPMSPTAPIESSDPLVTSIAPIERQSRSVSRASSSSGPEIVTTAEAEALASNDVHLPSPVPDSSIRPESVVPGDSTDRPSIPPEGVEDGITPRDSPAPGNEKIKPAISAPTLPKPRLPHDTIGLLEDRIKEDSRGDIEAWMNLIEEHKKRGKYDDARAVYKRVLELFPSAVCILDQHARSFH